MARVIAAPGPIAPDLARLARCFGVSDGDIASAVHVAFDEQQQWFRMQHGRLALAPWSAVVLET